MENDFTYKTPRIFIEQKSPISFVCVSGSETDRFFSNIRLHSNQSWNEAATWRKTSSRIAVAWKLCRKRIQKGEYFNLAVSHSPGSVTQRLSFLGGGHYGNQRQKYLS